VPFPAQFKLTALLRATGMTDFVAFLAGQGAPLSRDMPAAQLVRTLIAETAESFARFT